MIPATFSSKLILNVGADLALLDSREQLLRSAGYIVESVGSIWAAIYRYRTRNFNLIVICHSIAEPDRRCLTSLIRAYDFTAPVVFVAASSEPDTDCFADVTSESASCELLRSVSGALQRPWGPITNPLT
jgi:CheY-like chemotaxis protein